MSQMFSKNLIAAVLLASLVSACSPMQSQYVGEGMISKSADTIIADDISCVIDAPDFQLDTDVLSFQMTSNTGVGVGFNLATGLFKAIGVNFKSAKGQLDVAMHVYNPLRPNTPLVDANGQGLSKKINFGVDFNLSMISADASYYYQTPLALLSNDALVSTLDATKKKLAAVQNEWSTRVYKVVDENQFLVRVGRRAGVRVGDEFRVHNVTYEWEGASCASALVMARKHSADPAAIARVIQVDENSALLEVVDSVHAIVRGDVVSILKLPLASRETGSRGLARSLKLTPVSSTQLLFESNGVTQAMDLSPFMLQQLKSLVTKYGFYLE